MLLHTSTAAHAQWNCLQDNLQRFKHVHCCLGLQKPLRGRADATACPPRSPGPQDPAETWRRCWGRAAQSPRDPSHVSQEGQDKAQPWEQHGPWPGNHAALREVFYKAVLPREVALPGQVPGCWHIPWVPPLSCWTCSLAVVPRESNPTLRFLILSSASHPGSCSWVQRSLAPCWRCGPPGSHAASSCFAATRVGLFKTSQHLLVN